MRKRNKNNAKISILIKTDERSGQKEICGFRLGCMRYLCNLQVQMLDLEVRREIWAKDRDLDMKRTEGAVQAVDMNEFTELEGR